MSDQGIIYLLALLGYVGMVWTLYRRRSTTTSEWIKENRGGLIAGFIAVATVVLIGPGDNVDLGSYLTRTWAAGIGSGVAYLITGNVTTASGTERRRQARVMSARKMSDQ